MNTSPLVFTTPQTTRNQIYLFDIVKFCLAILVVQLHTTGYNIPFSRLAVPMFFTISGYLFFSEYRHKTCSIEKRRFLLHYLGRLASLYLFWFIIQLPYICIVRKEFFQGLVKGDFSLLFLILFNSTFVASWYLTTLFWGILILVCFSFLNNITLFIISFLMFISCLFCDFQLGPYQFLVSLYNKLSIFCIHPHFSIFSSLFYLVIGKIIAEETCHFINHKWYLFLLFFSIPFISLEHFFSNPFYIFGSYVFFTFLFIFAATHCMLHYSPTRLLYPKDRICILLRKMSTIIYCMHGGIALALRYIIWNLWGDGIFERFLIFPLTVLLSTFVAYLLITLAKNRKFYFLKYAY